MIDFRIQATNLTQVRARLDKIIRNLNDPKEGLERATHKVAGIFKENYDNEGSMVGGWPALSDYALNIRQWQGVPPGPILVRYGALRAIAVEFFQTARAGSSASAGGSYPFKTWSDQTVTGQLNVSGPRATLILGGSYKILNQWGHENWGPMSDVPARPFWFVGPQSIAASRDGIVEWIEDEVLA